jgi:drug/metabolite transporter (DMT)-like permease
MSKRITTRWYIGAWIVAVLAGIVMTVISRNSPGAGPPPGALLAYLVVAVCGIVMLVMWIGALVRLAQHRSWGWFTALLVVHLVFLGIIGMVAYAIAGPEDTTEVVTRPIVT